MTNKSDELFKSLSKAYSNTEIKNNPVFKKIIEENAAKLDDDNSNENYLKVILKFSNAISQYYLEHHEMPAEMLTIYNQIKADVPEDKARTDQIRKNGHASSLAGMGMVL
ncbi:bacteriocin immunity protein [Companilactobacillus jidongensis]|uniref:bacteriocin immunity protein n=1 Tax=Companilactobacillus jidongensis TaxID=2486006 RepID=UPI0013DDD515|nr:bacteriocin immunity protein [Companilactobacillus jidongensis]